MFRSSYPGSAAQENQEEIPIREEIERGFYISTGRRGVLRKSVIIVGPTTIV